MAPVSKRTPKPKAPRQPRPLKVLFNLRMNNQEIQEMLQNLQEATDDLALLSLDDFASEDPFSTFDMDLPDDVVDGPSVDMSIIPCKRKEIEDDKMDLQENGMV